MNTLMMRVSAIERLLESAKPAGAGLPLAEGVVSCCEELVRAGEAALALSIVGQSSEVVRTEGQIWAPGLGLRSRREPDPLGDEEAPNEAQSEPLLPPLVCRWIRTIGWTFNVASNLDAFAESCPEGIEGLDLSELTSYGQTLHSRAALSFFLRGDAPRGVRASPPVALEGGPARGRTTHLGVGRIENSTDRANSRKMGQRTGIMYRGP
jgi:hypothetical protein